MSRKLGRVRQCTACGEWRPTHAWRLCIACYQQQRAHDALPPQPPRGSVPCQDCGLRPVELRYQHRSNRGLCRGRCHGCYQRAWRAGEVGDKHTAAVRWATPDYLRREAV